MNNPEYSSAVLKITGLKTADIVYETVDPIQDTVILYRAPIEVPLKRNTNQQSSVCPNKSITHLVSISKACYGYQLTMLCTLYSIL